MTVWRDGKQQPELIALPSGDCMASLLYILMLSAGSEHLSSFAIFIGETLVTLIALLPLLHQRVVVVRNPGLMPWQLASNSQLLPPFLKKTFRKNNPSIYFQAFTWGRVAVAADPSYPHS